MHILLLCYTFSACTYMHVHTRMYIHVSYRMYISQAYIVWTVPGMMKGQDAAQQREVPLKSGLLLSDPQASLLGTAAPAQPCLSAKTLDCDATVQRHLPWRLYRPQH